MEQQPKAQITIHPLSHMTSNGREYAAICDGKIIATHYCSNDGWAQSDLGACGRKDEYDRRFPQGYEIKFSHEIAGVR